MDNERWTRQDDETSRIERNEQTHGNNEQRMATKRRGKNENEKKRKMKTIFEKSMENIAMHDSLWRFSFFPFDSTTEMNENTLLISGC